MQRILDPTFTEHSYGIRLGCSALDAGFSAQLHAQSGLRILVGVDLEKCSDSINHDIL